MASPYPDSSVFTGVTWDYAGRATAAPGSDEWPVCWADDDKLYVAWGDGGGFGGTDSDGRVSLGVASVSGTGASWTGHNIWGGKTPDTPATFIGKCTGIICIGGVLYMWITQDSVWVNGRMVKSTDHGLTWTDNGGGWDFQLTDGLMGDFACITKGKNYATSDGFVYGYTIETQALVNTGGPCYSYNLARVPVSDIMTPSAYQYWAGTTPCGNQKWSYNISDRAPAFTDPAGVWWGQRCWYHPVAQRYLLSIMRTETSDWGIFDAPNPWGPWTTVAYYTDWNGTNLKFCFGFNEKWMSVDGTELYMIVSDSDNFTVVKGTFTLA